MQDVKFMSAREKEMVLKQWQTFIKNGFKFENFTDRLYKHLSLHCSFIAHYNRAGFYSTYFENPADTARFLTQFDQDKGNISVEYGLKCWLTDPDYNDINQAMCKAIEPHKQTIYNRCNAEEREADLETARALLMKHGIEIKPRETPRTETPTQGDLFQGAA